MSFFFHTWAHLQKDLPYGFDSFAPICQTFENVY